MRALIIGAGMANKGAELMLRALVSEMRVRHPEIELGISPVTPQANRAVDLALHRLALPLPHVASKAFRPVFSLRNWFPGLVRPDTWSWRDLDLILDISGFSYSDQWGVRPAHNLALLAADVRRRGGHVILFPQAFGPFETPGHADHMRRALQSTSLVFARDATSHRYLLNLEVPITLKTAPDITVGFGAVSNEEGEWVAVVPNARMLDQGAVVWGASYIEILTTQIRSIEASGLHVRIVVHDDSGEDEALAARLALAASVHDVVVASDPMEVKQRLSEARFIIGSRFHAITSGLACGVPVVALGWSHKYPELLARYGLGDYCFAEPSLDIDSRVRGLLDHNVRAAVREGIAQTNEELALECEHMWQTVGACVRRSDHADSRIT